MMDRVRVGAYAASAVFAAAILISQDLQNLDEITSCAAEAASPLRPGASPVRASMDFAEALPGDWRLADVPVKARSWSQSGVAPCSLADARSEIVRAMARCGWRLKNSAFPKSGAETGLLLFESPLGEVMWSLAEREPFKTQLAWGRSE